MEVKRVSKFWLLQSVLESPGQLGNVEWRVWSVGREKGSRGDGNKAKQRGSSEIWSRREVPAGRSLLLTHEGSQEREGVIGSSSFLWAREVFEGLAIELQAFSFWRLRRKMQRSVQLWDEVEEPKLYTAKGDRNAKGERGICSTGLWSLILSTVLQTGEIV